MNDAIYVTQPSLAPREEVLEFLKIPWETGVLTHNGPLVQKLEMELCKKLNVKNFTTVVNGTIAIQMAIKALDLQGEIITTPFTWIATASAIIWERCTPVFVDIDSNTLNIDPQKIESKITNKTVAILPVHVFGNPCDVNHIEFIAKKHNLKVIYDAAHAIGSTYNGKSLLEYGDISTTSLHATKIYNTAEGGGCVTNDDSINEKLKRIRFFGHDENKDIVEDGTNAKMTEIHAALGLANLKYYDEVLDDRKNKYFYYLDGLSKNKKLTYQSILIGECNFSYFPVIFPSEIETFDVIKRLNKSNIFPRRYFYPSINTYTKILSYHNCPISEDISSRILCLPLYWKLNYQEIDRIINLINIF